MKTKDLEALVSQYKTALVQRKLTFHITMLLALISTVLMYRHISEDRGFFEGKPVSREAWIDQASEKFINLSSQIQTANYCVPLHVDIIQDLEVYFRACPDHVLAKQGQEYKINENYTVDASVARRFHFWKDVYSVWSSDQFVIHSSYYPEVVLETVDVSSLQEEFSTNERARKAQKLIRSRKRTYRDLLVKMHRMHRKKQAFETPAMVRIEKLMTHIEDRNKYWHVARALRTQRGQRDFIASGIQASGRYLPAIKKSFRDQGVPEELANIAFIESSFNLAAYSKVGAAGVYQIMPATGKQYMIIDDLIDERRDPIKSGLAAAKLLKLNYKLTQRWPLAITAYNHGVGGINRAIKTVKSREIIDLINNYNGRAFGFASKNFYTGFLGLLDTLEKSEKIFPNVLQFSELKFSTHRVSRPTTMGKLKEKLQISTDIVSFYNPDLSRAALQNDAVIPRGYILKYPPKQPMIQGESQKEENS